MPPVTLNLIVSYAKSGSNWTRMVLENYLTNGLTPANIWTHSIVSNGFMRSAFDHVMGASSLFLSREELADLTPLYLSEAIQSATEALFYKIHNLNEGLFTPEIKKNVRVVYLIRNPLDVAVSHCHHFGGDMASAVARLANDESMYNNPEKTLGGLLPITSGTWSHHVVSWIDQAELSIQVLRYEDMLSQPAEQFTRMINLFVGDVDHQRLQKAIEFSAFGALKAQESERGQAYHNHRGQSFFRKGSANTWRQELTANQVEAICSQHETVMRRFGYL